MFALFTSDRSATNAANAEDTPDSRKLRQATELAIESLARETRLDIQLVRSLYEHEHERLAAQAKIKTYLPVITARLVRMTLQREASTQIQ